MKRTKKMIGIITAFILIAAVFTGCEKDKVETKLAQKVTLSGSLKSAAGWPEPFDGDLNDRATAVPQTTVSYDATVTHTADGTGSAKFVKTSSGWVELVYGPMDFEAEEVVVSFWMKASSSASTLQVLLSAGGGTATIVAYSQSFTTSWAFYEFDITDELDILEAAEFEEDWDYQLEFNPSSYTTYWADDLDHDFEYPEVPSTSLAYASYNNIVGSIPTFIEGGTYSTETYGVGGSVLIEEDESVLISLKYEGIADVSIWKGRVYCMTDDGGTLQYSIYNHTELDLQTDESWEYTPASNSTWYGFVDFEMLTELTALVSSEEDWDWGDDYYLMIGAEDGNIYIDKPTNYWVWEAPEITGDTEDNIPLGNMPHQETFSTTAGYDGYDWECDDAGAEIISGGDGYNTVTYEFDTDGTKTIEVQYTEEVAYSLWSDEHEYILTTYEAEHHTSANAAADPYDNEADATTGWTGKYMTNGVFESQSSIKNVGSYAFHANCESTPTSGCGIYIDFLVSPYEFENGDSIKIEFDARHIGSGGEWDFRLSPGSNLGAVGSISIQEFDNADTSFDHVSHSFKYNSNTRFFGAREWSRDNDGGVYLDNVSIELVE